MDVIELSGEWHVCEMGKKRGVRGTVPGCVHEDLLRAGKIPDPFYRDNELAVRWIGETDWTYSREFVVRDEVLRHDSVVLVCDGLDTIARLVLNGRKIGATNNMFRTWEFDVKRLLKAGRNRIEIRFASAMGYVTTRNRKRRVPGWGGGRHKLDTGAWIRKEPCNFGWDWGPALVTCGIWRDIRLVAFSNARLTDVHVQQCHEGKRVRLDVGVAAEKRSRSRLRAVVTLGDGGRTVAESECAVTARGGVAGIDVPAPRLWWPAGMGEQPLYEVTVDLLDGAGELLDTATRRIGLRTLGIERRKDRWGESFQFRVNGVRFFAKGANWIPADAILSRLTLDDYRRLLVDAVDANMNMLRVWGGGIYEDDLFYDLCDELGICIWQDFMFSCSAYPSFDDEFMANVKAEAEDNVRRLRHHPSIALWCGNNELEQGLVADSWDDRAMSWADYGRLFDMLLPGVIKRVDPGRDYWPCSPHSPHGDRTWHRNPSCGDAHLWDVWHGRKPVEWYSTCKHRFVSEFGFQSFPAPATVDTYTIAADRNITSPIMEHHQRSGAGNENIIHYMLDWFRLPRGFRNTLWLSQILQSLVVQYAVEHWRRLMPRCMGALYWQLNDCWPVASWASIDYRGHWKALQYAARRFFAPVLLSAVTDAGKGTVDVFITNDGVRAFPGKVRWWLTTVDGRMLVEDTFRAVAGSGRSLKVKRLELDGVIERHGTDRLLVWLSLEGPKGVVSEALATFVKPKQMELPQPDVVVSAREGEGTSFVVALKCRRPALWVWLELVGVPARYGDNFFHLRPGAVQEVEVVPSKEMTLDRFRRKLRVKSLVDTY